MTSKLSTSLVRLLRNRSGSATLEFASTSMAFAAVVLGIVEFGGILETRNELHYAIDHGTRQVLLDPDADDTDIADAIRARFDHPASQHLSVVMGTEALNGVSYRTFSVRFPMSIYVPFVGNSITLELERRTPAI